MMFARVTTFDNMPEQQDEAMHYACEHVIPTLQRIDGFKGFYWLGSHQNNKALVVTLWDNEAAMDASEGKAGKLRTETDATVGSTVEDVKQYEVLLQVGPGRGSLPPLPSD